MASKYERPNSSVWWVKYRDETGRIRREATKFRVDVAMDTREAEIHVARLTLEEKSRRHAQRDSHAFSQWVPTFLTVTYGNSPKTLTKYRSSWAALEKFFTAQGITSPLHVKREHATEYLAWRVKQKVPGLKGKKFVSRNSALIDIAVFRLVMYEALKRAYISSNPISKLRLKPDSAREKPEFTPDQIRDIREALQKKPEWMRISFEIALYQGCRFAETSLPLSRVNLRDNTITFRIKGGRMHTTKLHPALRPMFEQMIAEGRTLTFEMPERNATRDWSRLFKRLKLKGYSFHCTRVTVITMLARAGVNEQQAMAYIGHSHAEIHRIYQRLKARDLDACVDALAFSTSGSNGIPDEPPATRGRASGSSGSHTGTRSRSASSPKGRSVRGRASRRAGPH